MAKKGLHNIKKEMSVDNEKGSSNETNEEELLEFTPTEIKGLETPHETRFVLKEVRDQAELRTVHKEARD